jgi:hypothetical protein
VFFLKFFIMMLGMSHFVLRVFPAFLALAGLVGCSTGVTEVPVSKQSTPATDVSRLQAWKDAERVAASEEGRITVIGSGESMRPIYGENTVLVLSKIAYADLKAGMQVGYVNQSGKSIVHVLREKDTQGWRVQGLNNDALDSERVTRYNLIGVVYASFATEEPGE